jgi:hypothetical protein
MNIDQEVLGKVFENLTTYEGMVVGPCSSATMRWCERHSLPCEIKNLFSHSIPKTEVWAGAGALFCESEIVRWNEDFPEAIHARLLIVGSAANGDHITLDLNDGAIGYISHEHDWKQDPRQYFIRVSASFGLYVRDINENPTRLPEDYWFAKKALSTGN